MILISTSYDGEGKIAHRLLGSLQQRPACPQYRPPQFFQARLWITRWT